MRRSIAIPRRSLHLGAIGLGVVFGAVDGCAVYDSSLIGTEAVGGVAGNGAHAGSTDPTVGGAGSNAGGVPGTAGTPPGSGAGAGSDVGGEAGSDADAAGTGGLAAGGSATMNDGGGANAGSAGAAAGNAGANAGGGGGSGSGGSGGAGAAGAGTWCTSTSVGSGTLGLIDDLDDGNAFIAAVDGRAGTWTFATDGTGSTVPSPGNTTPSAPGKSGLAQRVQGTALTGAGATLAANLVANGACYDASAYRGVNIALKGSGQVEVSLLTAAVNAQPPAKQDQFKVQVTLTNAWQDQSFAWSEFHQSGYPGATVVAFDAAKVTGISITPRSASKPLSFDVYVDDLSFRKKP